MVATTEKNTTTPLNTTTTTNNNNNGTKSAEPKARALNFTIHDLNSSMQKLHKHTDLSDVSMDDDDDNSEIDVEDHDSLDSKRFPQSNLTLGNFLFCGFFLRVIIFFSMIRDL